MIRELTGFDLYVEKYRVKEGASLHLGDCDPEDAIDPELTKERAAHALGKMNKELARLQQLLFAEAKHKMIVVLQGMDSSGKDGTIRQVFSSVDPLGVNVANFKRPTLDELAHDYLWRVHRHTPPFGFVTIFNRSHYEDVLVPRVHSLVPEERWRNRFAHIVDFERMLADEGAVILKFFLHISRDEQGRRLQERLVNPTKQWKFEHGDLHERRHWHDYTIAYEEAINRTSTDFAPWYIVPANRKWYRNLVVSEVLINALHALEMSYPPPRDDIPASIEEFD